MWLSHTESIQNCLNQKILLRTTCFSEGMKFRVKKSNCKMNLSLVATYPLYNCFFEKKVFPGKINMHSLKKS